MDGRSLSAGDTDAAIKRMSLAELWAFVQDGEAAGGTAAPATGNNLQGATLAAPLLSKPGAAAPKAATGGVLGFCYSCLTCFDMGENFRKGLMKRDGGVPEMRVLNGLRVLSMGWVVLGHTFLYMNQGGERADPESTHPVVRLLYAGAFC